VRNSVPVHRLSFDNYCLQIYFYESARRTRELKLLTPVTRIQIRVTQ
jgi:hypothetical protein